MFKRWTCFILIFIVVLSSSAVFADAQSEPNEYNITATKAGGRYELGEVELTHKKDFIEKEVEPVIFTVQLYTKNEVPFIDSSVQTRSRYILID